MLIRFLRGCLRYNLLLFLVLFQVSAQSETVLSPSIEVRETFISNKTATRDETGNITSISPGISYQATGSKASISLDYILNARAYNDLSQDDGVDQSLVFRSSFSHVPERWESYVTSIIRQANVSADGIQTVNPDIQSDNTRELRTLGVGTALQGKWTEGIDYESQLSADFADFEDSDDSESSNILIGVSNNSTKEKFNWRTYITSQATKRASQEEQIDKAVVDLNYRINFRYSVFTSITKSETGNRFLDKTNTIVGLQWTPNRESFFKFGTGTRGDDTSYFLDAKMASRRVAYSLNYDEAVTTSRSQLIDEANQDGFFPTSQTLSITPVLRKNGRFVITATGLRTDLSVVYFKQTVERDDLNSDESKEGLSLNIERSLSAISSIQLFLSTQDSKAIQENKIDDQRLSYVRQLSDKARYSVELRNTEQTSNVLENEFKQESLTFRLFSSF